MVQLALTITLFQPCRQTCLYCPIREPSTSNLRIRLNFPRIFASPNITMTTVASPRISSSIRSPSSSRTSLDTTNRPINTRRNRAALRDYYGLKGAAAGSPDPNNGAQALDTGKQDSDVSELDQEGFDAQAYVKDVLSKQGLEGVLRVEAGLVSGKSLQSTRCTIA